MRITYYSPTEKGHGGVTVVLEQMKYLKTHGVEVELVQPGQTPKQKPDIAIATWCMTVPQVQGSGARLKGYLVQHDEGISYGLGAYETYKLPWDFAIATASWTQNFMKKRTKTHLYIQGIDHELFYRHMDKNLKQVLFFLRKSHRKNWEVGFEALRLIKQKRKDISTVTFDMEPIEKPDFIDKHIVALPYEKMSELYSESTVYMQSTPYEGFGALVMECMASGTMVVTPDRVGTEDFASDIVDYVDAYNPTEIAERCIYWIDHPLERKVLELKGMDRVKEFTWDKAGEELLNFLNTL